MINADLKAEPTGHQPGQQSADRIEIVFYTDPLCCWSWALEPQWRLLQYQYRNVITVRYCIGGLISDWNNFHDSANSISRPIQFGPLWNEARHISGMPVYDRIWFSDPPSTSYTACVAVKCAFIQSNLAGQLYLRRCREELMISGINISKQKELFLIADKLAKELKEFDTEKFKSDYISGPGTEAFKGDLQEVRYNRINRFPTIKFRSHNGKTVLISGYKKYDFLEKVLQDLNVVPQQGPVDKDSYIRFYGSLLERELQEVRNETILN